MGLGEAEKQPKGNASSKQPHQRYLVVVWEGRDAAGWFVGKADESIHGGLNEKGHIGS